MQASALICSLLAAELAYSGPSTETGSRATLAEAGDLSLDGLTTKVAPAPVAGAPEGPAPPNNNCGNAIPIGEGSTAFDTTGATTDGNPDVRCRQFTNDPAPQGQVWNDVWYNYTPAVGGIKSISLCGSSFDTKLAVYAGCTTCPPAAPPLVCSDDNCANFAAQSAVIFPAAAGNCYRLRIGGFDSTQTGTGTVTIGNNCTVTCPTGASPELQPPGGACALGTNDTVNGGCNAPGAPFEAIACNQTICGISGTGFNSATGLNNRDLDWYSVTLTTASVITWSASAEFRYNLVIMNNVNCPPATAIFNGSFDPCSVNSVAICTPAGAIYPLTLGLVIAPQSSIGQLCPLNYWATLSCSPAGSGPPNDLCQNATPVSEGTFAFSNLCADLAGDGGAIDSCAASGESDVYFAYTATVSGLVTISLCSANFDTVLAVYPGFTCPVADPGPGFCNDDFCAPSGGSQLSIAVNAGDQWLIRISGFAGAQGSGNLVISAPLPGVIIAANPPTAGGNPYEPSQPFRDVLDTGTTAALTRGIGAAGTPPQGPIQYAPILVTFGDLVTFGTSDVSIACTRTPCPTVVSVSSSGNTSTINLSGAIPPLGCTTLTFWNAQRVQYRSHPANSSMDSASNTQDLLALVVALNNGSANLAGNLARYNVDRMHGVNTLDLLRLVQLLNGTNTTQVFSGATVDACPP
ncbi:MAG TPA: hypothetical protein VGM03_10965 [Phycisphaerae bacterium]|jgi:hypothetical protein